MKTLLELSGDLSQNQSVSIRFTAFEPMHEEIILTLLGQTLAEYHLNYLENIVATVLNELINNSSKANLKRVYFQRETMNIHNSDDYERLINTFKEEAVVKIKEFKNILEKESMYVEFGLDIEQKGIRLHVSNNVEMTEEEKLRASERIQNASNLSTMAEAFEIFGSDEEGAGLGIVLNIQLLKNAGIAANNFIIESKNGITRSELFIPFSIRRPESLEKIHNRVMEEVTVMPVFSQDIQALLSYIQSNDYKKEKVIEFLERDPGLTAEILREANIFSEKKIQFDSLSVAIESLGQDGVYQAIAASSTRKILENRYNDFKLFWDISRKCAYYARQLGIILSPTVSLERLYLAGMFHNLGKLIIYSLHPELVQSISNTTLEEIHMGVSNAQVGAMVAEKWGYSVELVSLIKNYPRPLSSPIEIRLEAGILHISEYLIKKEKEREKFIYLDVNCLPLLGIKDKTQLELIHQDLINQFQSLNDLEIQA
ncbi:HDOD domain-containing protein [Leptospira sp. GIMC2001]|uniref:HDOD domain-containing protein n=1 Tax=Leptospira sp. GIMC2001 TaxID=1513297 RepID=UPI00234AB851|nr:HDOD domain-containing protein [Leptospira sp. GIMC2001]WCL48833.1 HDOD domain-containing protein [Leptospira sp. GIMC2001]